MHPLVSFNQEIIKAEDASMSPVSVSGLYGKGVFTTLAIRDSQPFLFEKHWERLSNNTTRLGIDFEGISKEMLLSSLAELISKNDVKDGRCRITVFDSSSSKIWLSLTDRKSSVLMQTADPRKRPKMLRLGLSPFVVASTAPLNNIKTCNYLEQTLSYDAALNAGFDEAIRVNERHEIVSACMANIFWVRNGQLFTPQLDVGCLHGTTRGFVAENIPVEPVRAHFGELISSDHVFLTSAGIGLAEVSEIYFEKKEIVFEPIGEEFYSIKRLNEIRWQ